MPVIDQEGDIDAGSSVANHMDIDAGLFHGHKDVGAQAAQVLDILANHADHGFLLLQPDTGEPADFFERLADVVLPVGGA